MSHRIAVDMDSTLTQTTMALAQLLKGEDHGYTYKDIPTWGWVGEEFGNEAFEGFSTVWEEYPKYGMDPMEPNLAETIAALHDGAEYVDILTTQPLDRGITDAKQRWLLENDIPYNLLRPVETGTTKADYVNEYDFIIDDKPALPAKVNAMNEKMGTDCLVMLRNHKYNWNAPGEYKRVSSVREAQTRIKNGRIVV